MKSLQCGRRSAAVGKGEDQNGRGEQRPALKCAVVLRPDRGVHGKRSGSPCKGVRGHGGGSFKRLP